MGRPINKRLVGLLATTGEQIQCSAWVPGDSQARVGSIIRQKGSNTYIVDTTAAGGAIGRCKMVNATAGAAGEMTVSVFPYGSSASGTGGTATTTLRVKTIAVNAGGTGYAENDVITVTGGTGTSATAIVITENAGAVTELELVTLGNYSVLPSATGAATTTSGSGTGLTVDLTFELSIATITGVGSDYIAPTVTISGSGGGAGTVNVVDGSIDSITYTDRGTYTAVPTLTIVAGSGSVTKYARIINAHQVKTYDGLVYRWQLQGQTIVEGEAQIQSA